VHGAYKLNHRSVITPSMQGVDPAIYLSVTKQTLYQYDITASLKDEEEIEDI